MAHFSGFQVRKTRKHWLITEFFCDFSPSMTVGICPICSHCCFSTTPLTASALHQLPEGPASTHSAFLRPPGLYTASILTTGLSSSSTAPAGQAASRGSQLCCVWVHHVNFWDTYPWVWNPKYLDKSVALFPHHRDTEEEKSPTHRVTSQISRINGSIVLFHLMDMAQKEEESKCFLPQLMPGGSHIPPL